METKEVDMPQRHSAETRAKMRASALRTWQDPDIRESRISGLLKVNASRRPAERVAVRLPNGQVEVLPVVGQVSPGGVPLVEIPARDL